MAWQSGLTSGTPFVLVQRNNTDVRFYVDAGYRFTIPHATTDFKVYVLNYDGTNWNLYVNGVAQSAYTGGLAQQSDATGLYLGNGFNGYANVDVMEAVVYDYVTDPAALSSELMSLAGL